MNDQNDPNQPGTQTPSPPLQGENPQPQFDPTQAPTEPAPTPPFAQPPSQDIASFSQPQTPSPEPTPASQPTWQIPSDQPSNQGTTTPPSANLSPLDNPWGVPAQSPPIDSGTTPPAVPQTIVSESAPTDLSHLIGNNNQPEENSPQQSTLETLVAPPVNTGPDVTTTPQVEHKGIPKWLIGVGIGLFLLVVVASAYFILGIGRAPDTTSIPATQVPKTTQQVKPPAPLPTPVSQPAATGSASFGELQGGSTGGQQATSAAELLRQRQGR